MKCERARDLFSEYLEGSIDNALTETVRSHIDRCEACRREFEGVRMVWTALRTMPEVEPPVDFRHNVVMQVARLQHGKAESAAPRRSGWESFLQWLTPVRASAVAAGVLLVGLSMFGLTSTGSSKWSAGLLGGGQTDRPSAVLHSDPSMDGRISEWQNRKLLRNTVWTTVSLGRDNSGMTIYCVRFSANNNALMSESLIGTLPVEIRYLPSGTYNAEAAKAQAADMRGSVSASDSLQFLVNVGQGETQKILVSWRVRGQRFSQLVILPSQIRSIGGASVNGQLYSTLETVAMEYAAPVVANGELKDVSLSASLGAGALGSELRKCLRGTRYDWLLADGAVYVDKTYVTPNADE